MYLIEPKLVHKDHLSKMKKMTSITQNIDESIITLADRPQPTFHPSSALSSQKKASPKNNVN